MRTIDAGTGPSSSQAALKAKHGLTDQQFREMLEMLTDLSPAERASLGDPDFITEDEADLIYSARSASEPGPRTSLDELLAEAGIPRRRRTA